MSASSWRTLCLLAGLIGCAAACRAVWAAEPVRGVTPLSEVREAPTLHRGKSMGILVGVQDYTGLPKLEYCNADVRLMEKTLKEYCDFDEVYTLTDDAPDRAFQPTVGQLYQKLPHLLEVANSGQYERVLLYFAGHGFLENEQLYFAPVDCVRANLSKTGLMQADVMEWLNKCDRVRVKMLILDCCHSGEGRGDGIGVTGAAAVDLFAEAKGLITLASCDAHQVSLEWPEQKQGLFTYFLCRGLEGYADTNSDGWVDTSEIYRYVLENVLAQSLKMNRKQNVVQRSFGWTGIATLSRVAHINPELFALREQLPEGAKLLLDTAAALQNEGRYRQAIERWEDYIDRFSETSLAARVWHYSGVCRLALGQFDVAAFQFRRALSQGKEDPGKFQLIEDTYLNLGYCYYSQGAQAKSPVEQAAYFDQAVETFAEADRSFPPYSKFGDQVLFFWGESLYKSGKLAESAAIYDRLVKEHPKSSLRRDGLYALGVAREELAQLAEAGEIYDRFIREFAPSDRGEATADPLDTPSDDLLAEVRLRRAQIIKHDAAGAAQQGRREQAHQLLARAEKLYQEAAATRDFRFGDVALLNQAECAQRRGEFARAAALYADLPARFASSAYRDQAFTRAGECFYRAGDLDAAGTWYDKVLEAGGPHKPEAAHWRCHIFLKQAKPEEAVRLATEVLKEPEIRGGPYGPYLQLDLADALFYQPPRKLDALAAYQQLYKDSSEHALAPQVLYNAAVTALQVEQYDLSTDLARQFQARFAAHPLLADVKHVAAEASLQRRDFKAAEKAFAELIRAFPNHASLPAWKQGHETARRLAPLD